MSETANGYADTVKSINIHPGPWTRQAKELAILRETRDAFQSYFRKSVKTRNWTPWDDLPLHEMKDRGHLLSEDTVTLIESFLGVEDYVGDYVEDSMHIVGKIRERRNIQLQWGAEELKHAESWELVLLHSGVRTEEQLSDYRDKVAEHKWTMRENHPGLDTPLGVVVYAMVQERATYFNYDELRKRIRSEYGLPEKATPEERARGSQIGAAGAFKVVANDEIAHHAIFLQLFDIYKRYLPYEAFDTLFRVFTGFNMPALYLIPNELEMREALYRTKLYTPLKHGKYVANPILDALGLKDRRALERAVQEAKLLPEGLGPEHVKVGRSGEFIVSMTAQEEPALV